MFIAFLIAQAAGAATPPPLPTPFTEAHKQSIGCVGALAVLAERQRQGNEGASAYADVREDGPVYAGIVGARIMEETGHPRVTVAAAMQAAAQSFAQHGSEGAGDILAGCIPAMRVALAADAAEDVSDGGGDGAGE